MTGAAVGLAVERFQHERPRRMPAGLLDRQVALVDHVLDEAVVARELLSSPSRSRYVRESPMLAKAYVPSLVSATAVRVVLMPDMCGRFCPDEADRLVAPRDRVAQGGVQRPAELGLVEVLERLDDPAARDLAGRRAADPVGDRGQARAGVDRVLIVLAPSDVAPGRAFQGERRDICGNRTLPAPRLQGSYSGVTYAPDSPPSTMKVDAVT